MKDPCQILTCSCGTPKATITEPYRGSLDRRDLHVCPECDRGVLELCTAQRGEADGA